MSYSTLPRQKLFGLFELDAAGMVLYSGRGGGRDSAGPAAGALGHNFYSEIAPFANVEEFRQRLDAFNRGAEQAHSFVFSCEYEDGALPVRVLLARVRERVDGNHTESLLVHIKEAD